MNGFCLITGLLLGAVIGYWAARRQFMQRYGQINAIIHANRHRHPALILERIQHHIQSVARR